MIDPERICEYRLYRENCTFYQGKLMKDLSGKVAGNKTIVDVCSVKVYPKDMMLKYLPADSDIIATHPLFGPDSFQERGSVMMMEKVRDAHDRYDFWKSYFESQNIINIDNSFNIFH